MLYLPQKVLTLLTAAGILPMVALAAWVVLAVGHMPAHGEEGPPRKLEHLKERRSETQQQMEERQRDIRTFSREEKDVIDSLNEIDLSIDAARKRIAGAQKELQTLEDEISGVLAKSESVKAALHARKTHADERMVSLYKLNRLGRMQVLAGADSLTDFLRRRNALAHILEEDRATLADYKERRTALSELSERLDRQRARRATVKETYSRELADMEHRRTQRAALLREIRDRKALREASLAALRRQAAALDEKIASFRIEKPKKAPSTGNAPTGFARLKGLLKLPVEGRIISSFGPYRNKEYGVMNFQSGIDIQADRGAPIRSVHGGRVIFSNWFKGYGNMIIIDHEDHYYTLYAHAEELFKRKGDPVHADEVIGTVGDSGAVGDPVLHFEVRHHGKPVDPMTWLNKG
ncbi:murein hydrolase activator EnvC family protein [Desulfococcus multivorans]|uniref:Peptidase M23 n=1 Tax=Desulfococcus multivorans DSM 2059 TaxID=1121405 RepID=S7VBY6_DESML|nr:peptidoglycan DD-metalloendopeptidase family protein [Desulfococcus multivorans]AQU99819.2 hypothetical protein B2D07_02870 [Desulfococcus multivorans]EPR42003.1 Peptidase M23 [Desulfococcus multivorans DSM 2059]SKA10541.1 Septal ring factor EnvC, activator of murein hydrolases AmiA and AmiB [Desulfococcus multivorans DSM 2059]